jgi:kynurenine formamidase
MKRFVSVALGWMLCTGGIEAAAQSWSPPTDAERCPSRWGAGDERGSANHMNPETVLRAARLIRTGEVFELGHVLHPSIPFVGTRRFELHTKRTVMNPQSNRRGSNEEIVYTELGQVGTQIDAFAHQTIGGTMYNCFAVDEVATRTGFAHLGIEKIGTLMTRGVLIDVAGLRGVETLPGGYEITREDLEQALARQNLVPQPGDALLVHTGWGRLWGVDNTRYVASAPGLGIAAAEWLALQDPLLVGADTAPINASPDPDPDVSNAAHQILLVVNGILLLENLRLQELADRGIGEFALVVQPLKIEGGTGSTVAPSAIR